MDSLHITNARYVKYICTYSTELSICMNTILTHFVIGISNNVAEKMLLLTLSAYTSQQLVTGLCHSKICKFLNTA